jgi:hypothetical protein
MYTYIHNHIERKINPGAESSAKVYGGRCFIYRPLFQLEAYALPDSSQPGGLKAMKLTHCT